MKTEHHNVTLSLPKPLLQQFRVYAAKRNQSMTGLLTDAIRKMVVHEDEYEKASKRLLERIRNPPGRSAEGKITWTREEIHER